MLMMFSDSTRMMLEMDVHLQIVRWFIFKCFWHRGLNIVYSFQRQSIGHFLDTFLEDSKACKGTAGLHSQRHCKDTWTSKMKAHRWDLILDGNDLTHYFCWFLVDLWWNYDLTWEVNQPDNCTPSFLVFGRVNTSNQLETDGHFIRRGNWNGSTTGQLTGYLPFQLISLSKSSPLFAFPIKPHCIFCVCNLQDLPLIILK